MTSAGQHHAPGSICVSPVPQSAQQETASNLPRTNERRNRQKKGHEADDKPASFGGRSSRLLGRSLVLLAPAVPAPRQQTILFAGGGGRSSFQAGARSHRTALGARHVGTSHDLAVFADKRGHTACAATPCSHHDACNTQNFAKRDFQFQIPKKQICFLFLARTSAVECDPAVEDPAR